MNTKRYLKWLIIDIAVFIISSLFVFSGIDNLWITTPAAILWYISLVYIVIFVPFIIIQNYCVLKRIIIEEPLNGHRKTIERNSRWPRDAISFFSFSIMFNFLLFLLFSTTPLIPTLEEAPYVHMLNLPKLSDNRFGGLGYNPGDDIIILIIIFAGPGLLFTLRQLHYKMTQCANMQRYPGSRLLLLFFYVVPIISFANIGLTYYNDTLNGGKPPDVLIPLNFPILDTIVIIGSFIIVMIWICDRKLFSEKDQVRIDSNPS